MTTAPAEAKAGAETEPAALLDAIKLAVAAANAAEQGMTTAQAKLSTAQAELLSRSTPPTSTPSSRRKL